MTIYDIKFDSNHDMHLSDSDLAFTAPEDAVVQRLTIRLQFLYAEWFLDNRKGVPYTQFIFTAGADLEDIYNIFRQHVKDTDGVDSIEKLELTPDGTNRTLAVELSVNNGLTISVTASPLTGISAETVPSGAVLDEAGAAILDEAGNPIL